MNLNAVKIWEIAGGVVLLTGAAAVGTWLLRRKRPTPAEIELGRRQFLTQSGRIVDGTLLDVAEVPGEDGNPLTMLMYEYRIGGVDYEASQDITLMGDVVTVAHVRSGFPCSVRYQPGNPENSIVVAEGWSGLRKTVPLMTVWDDRQRGNSARLHTETSE
ncbi:hypothetical protein [Occallatibacter riparius]|uniref:DUF3592 domain-containing protein n=1 Tax=Occallatibacter riparius TaxID=1002689 RepID=A0A9J7BQA4_9BACT|nr:hypothetical protein [Occallatibacter riparius]UWZ84737.1 hypothetical protein MOP44_02095 [Occallatibacter riparius]